MKMRRAGGLLCLVAPVLIGTCQVASARGREPEVKLTPHGEELFATYSDMLAKLRAEIVASVPTVDEAKRAAFIAAHAAVATVPPQPNPDNLKMAPPRYAPSHKLYAEAQSKAAEAVAPLLGVLDSFLDSDKLDDKLRKLALLAHATPRGLAVFAQQGAEHEALIDQLLGDDALIKQAMELGGAYQGKYGQAMRSYKAIQKASKRATEGFFQRFALASSMEHPDGCLKRDGMAPAEVNVDVFLDYEKAYLEGKLDEAFGTYSDFNWRFVMHHYRVEDMNWMRDMLRNYRPDHIRNPDYKWRYCRITRTDVPYTSNVKRPVRPDLNLSKFQDFFLEGGICGPRCFTGKLACAAFGIPVRYARQTGHAAFSHWTPDGWTVVFGAHWTFNRHRDICGLDFSLEERARNEPEEYMKVLRAEWVGDALEETKVSKSHYGVGGGFWNALAFYKKLAIVEEAELKALELTGSELAESNEPAESKNSSWTPEMGSSEKAASRIPQVKLTEADKTIVLGEDGVITIPVAACAKPVSTEKIRFMKTIDGDGIQGHYNLAGNRPELLKYYVNAPAAGEYELTARVVTVTVDRTFLLRLNRRTMVNIPLPYTKGMWADTAPVTIALRKGRNTLMFTARAPNKGVTIKHFKLTPVSE